MGALIAALLVAISTVTGISRPIDAELTALAQHRAAEITTTFDHRYLTELNNGRWDAWGEVLAFERYQPDPVGWIAQAWDASPDHHAILWDASLTRIGCAAVEQGRTYVVCIVARPTLPNTALEWRPDMNILASILIYSLTLIAAPIVLLFYSEFSKALLTLILSITIIGIPVAMLIGVMAVRSHRRPRDAAYYLRAPQP